MKQLKLKEQEQEIQSIMKRCNQIPSEKDLKEIQKIQNRVLVPSKFWFNQYKPGKPHSMVKVVGLCQISIFKNLSYRFLSQNFALVTYKMIFFTQWQKPNIHTLEWGVSIMIFCHLCFMSFHPLVALTLF